MKLTRYTAEEWSALYVDGILDRVGDSYLIDERISQLCNVDTYDSDAFLRGGNSREDVAKTLDELHAYEKQEADAVAEREAQELERQALELEAQAAALRARAKA